MDSTEMGGAASSSSEAGGMHEGGKDAGTREASSEGERGESSTEQNAQKRPREEEGEALPGEAARAKLPLKEWVDDVPEMEGYKEEDDCDWSPSDEDHDISDESDLLSDSTRNTLSSHSSSEAHEVRDTAPDRVQVDRMEVDSDGESAARLSGRGVGVSPSRGTCGETGGTPQGGAAGGVGLRSFVASAVYEGKREGHVFREGLLGLGYYRDWGWRGEQQSAAVSGDARPGGDGGGAGDAAESGEGGEAWGETAYNVTERGTKVVIAEEVLSDEVERDANFVDEVEEGGDGGEEEEMYGYKEYDEEGNRVNASAWQKMICDAVGIKCRGPGGDDGGAGTVGGEGGFGGGGGGAGEWGDEGQVNPFIDAFVRAARNEGEGWGWGPRAEGYVKVTPPGPGEAYQFVDGDEGWEELEGPESTDESALEWMSPEEIAEAHPGQAPPAWFEGGMPTAPQLLNASDIVAQTKRHTCGCASMLLPCLTCQGVPRCMMAPTVQPMRELGRREWARAVPDDAGRTEWPAEEGEETEELIYYKDYPPIPPTSSVGQQAGQQG